MGGGSQIKAELLLFESVSESGAKYDYVHLLSGVDLPIKSQNEIHEFCDNLKIGTNLVGFAQGEFNQADLKNKTSYYHLFVEYQKGCNPLIRKFCKLCRMTWLSIQKKIGLTRKWNKRLYKGAQWVSITGDFCNYLVNQKHQILSSFKGVPCADEIFIQTAIANSPFADTVFDYGIDFAGGTRLIDWTRGKPYIWRKCDFELIMKSNCLFARKFSSTVDKKIIDLIYKTIKT